jgi:hypothetical protein
VTWNENKTKSIKRECWNVYWSVKKRVQSRHGAEDYIKIESFGTRYFKMEQMQDKLDKLYADPTVCEVYVVHHNPVYRWDEKLLTQMREENGDVPMPEL